MPMSRHATEAVRRERRRRRPDRSATVHLSRVQRVAQQESLTAALFEDRRAWVQAVYDAGLHAEATRTADLAYAGVGRNRVYHGYWPRAGGPGYLDLRASYTRVETMMTAIRECTAMTPRRRRLSESALTSYFKRDGLTVELDGDVATVWTADDTAYGDAVRIAAGLGAQVGPVEDVEDGSRYGIRFPLLQARYPETAPDPSDAQYPNAPAPVRPGVNERRRRRVEADALDQFVRSVLPGFQRTYPGLTAGDLSTFLFGGGQMTGEAGRDLQDDYSAGEGFDALVADGYLTRAQAARALELYDDDDGISTATTFQVGDRIRPVGSSGTGFTVVRGRSAPPPGYVWIGPWPNGPNHDSLVAADDMVLVSQKKGEAARRPRFRRPLEAYDHTAQEYADVAEYIRLSKRAAETQDPDDIEAAQVARDRLRASRRESAESGYSLHVWQAMSGSRSYGDYYFLLPRDIAADARAAALSELAVEQGYRDWKDAHESGEIRVRAVDPNIPVYGGTALGEARRSRREAAEYLDREDVIADVYHEAQSRGVSVEDVLACSVAQSALEDAAGDPEQAAAGVESALNSGRIYDAATVRAMAPAMLEYLMDLSGTTA